MFKAVTSYVENSVSRNIMTGSVKGHRNVSDDADSLLEKSMQIIIHIPKLNLSINYIIKNMFLSLRIA